MLMIVIDGYGTIKINDCVILSIGQILKCNGLLTYCESIKTNNLRMMYTYA
jgi:hypothetical protein